MDGRMEGEEREREKELQQLHGGKEKAILEAVRKSRRGGRAERRKSFPAMYYNPNQVEFSLRSYGEGRGHFLLIVDKGKRKC